MNLQHSVLETDALPIELHPCTTSLKGVEPPTFSFVDCYSFQLSYRDNQVLVGFEPTVEVLQTFVLPLHYRTIRLVASCRGKLAVK